MASFGARSLTLLAIVLISSSAAFARGPSPLPGLPDQDIVAGSRPFPQMERERDALEARGHRLGSIVLLPQIEVTPKYNSNLFATAEDKRGDVLAVISPSLAARSNWGRHALNLQVSGDIGRYREYTSENFDDYGASIDGRIDVHRDSQILFGASHSRLHEERGSPDDVDGAEPTEYDQASGDAAYLHRSGRLSTRFGGSWVRYDYRDVPAATGAINNDDRDRDEYATALRVGYEVTQNFQAYMRGTLNLRDYVSARDDGGFNRDSWGYEAIAGALVDLGGITLIDGFAGILGQDYEDPRLATVAGPAFGGAINWNPIRPLWLRAYARRFVAETSQVEYTASVNTEVGLVVALTPRPDVGLTLRTVHLTSDYKRNAVSAAAVREDDLLISDIRLRYFLNRNLYAGPAVKYVRRDSTLPSRDYSQTIALFRFGVRY